MTEDQETMLRALGTLLQQRFNGVTVHQPEAPRFVDMPVSVARVEVPPTLVRNEVSPTPVNVMNEVKTGAVNVVVDMAPVAKAIDRMSNLIERVLAAIADRPEPAAPVVTNVIPQADRPDVDVVVNQPPADVKVDVKLSQEPRKITLERDRNGRIVGGEITGG